MCESMNAHVSKRLGHAAVALQSVNIEAVLNNLLCEVTIHQKYKNMETVNIEAVCTFPLPLNAVLLDLTIKTKTKLLRGIVVEKLYAENQYEDAIIEGDTAIMLEQIQPGFTPSMPAIFSPRMKSKYPSLIASSTNGRTILYDFSCLQPLPHVMGIPKALGYNLIRSLNTI
jgi:hypothetical protein